MNTLPPVSTMYRAILDRDPSFEGIFIVAVRTTGIFCRPTCPARKPRRDNVEFFGSSREALGAGYRPCLRCAPLREVAGAPALIMRLMKMADETEDGRISDADLRRAQIDPSTARRQFRRFTGMTFHAYNRARKLGSALSRVRNGDRVIDAQVENGFESASGFWEAFKKTFGAPPGRSAEIECLLARRIETPLGPMLAVADDRGLHLLEFIDRRILEKEIVSIRKRTGAPIIPGDHVNLGRIEAELKSYFAGSGMEFSTPTVLAGTPFERSVWSLLREIPPGGTRSYSDIARDLGRPDAVRAVGRANGRNSLALIIPCHRVIRSDGNLCGYGGGIWRKKWLLEHERSVCGKATAETLNLFARQD